MIINLLLDVVHGCAVTTFAPVVGGPYCSKLFSLSLPFFRLFWLMMESCCSLNMKMFESRGR